MPKETDRLKLPLPLGNENVTRESINGIFEKIDAGVATQVDLDALREAVSQMDIPDASLTQKGRCSCQVRRTARPRRWRQRRRRLVMRGLT